MSFQSQSNILKRNRQIALTVPMMIGFGNSAFAVSHENLLNDDTKRVYYAQYVKIVKDVSQQSGIDIIVNPVQEFAEEDWKTPEDFRDLITEIAEWDIRCDASNVSKTKTAKVDADGKSFEIAVTGTFTTQYNSTTQRQHFQSVDTITSKISSGSASWTQTGYEGQSLDAARTVAIYVSGTLKVAQATFRNKLAYVEFYCSDKGEVS
ncbi:MAG: hypothetical protein ACLUDG_00990 [Butyricicoccus sp.]